MTTWNVQYRRINEHVIPGKRLGRHVAHDSRNLNYRHQRTAGSLASVLHARNAPILDQGNTGSCTGNAQVGVLASDPDFAAVPKGTALNEALALRVYSGAEVIDGGAGLPSEDNGSSGPSAAKAAMKLGLISGYTHCLSLADVLDALQSSAVSIGINWYDSFDPYSGGLLTISPSASVRGGHEPMLRGVDAEARTVFGDNSWGESWGVKGSFTMGWDTLDRLLHEQGDGTVSVPLSQPAPVPVPPGPVPVPAAGDDALLWSRTSAWARGRHVGGNARAATALLIWAKGKNFS